MSSRGARFARAPRCAGLTKNNVDSVECLYNVYWHGATVSGEMFMPTRLQPNVEQNTGRESAWGRPPGWAISFG